MSVCLVVACCVGSRIVQKLLYRRCENFHETCILQREELTKSYFENCYKSIGKNACFPTVVGFILEMDSTWGRNFNIGVGGAHYHIAMSTFDMRKMGTNQGCGCAA